MEYISCNMGTCDLPEIYTLTLRLRPRARVYISGKSLMPMLQLLQAVKIECGPQKGYGEKRCEIQSGGQEIADDRLMVKILITTIQVTLVPLGLGTKFT